MASDGPVTGRSGTEQPQPPLPNRARPTSARVVAEGGPGKRCSPPRAEAHSRRRRRLWLVASAPCRPSPHLPATQHLMCGQGRGASHSRLWPRRPGRLQHNLPDRISVQGFHNGPASSTKGVQYISVLSKVYLASMQFVWRLSLERDLQVAPPLFPRTLTDLPVHARRARAKTEKKK